MSKELPEVGLQLWVSTMMEEMAVEMESSMLRGK
jgi:hypothetical protein